MAFHPIRCAVQRERSFPASAGRYALTAALRGSGLLRAAGSDRLFRRGDVALLPPGLSHSCVSTDKLEICSFFFAPDEVIAPQADLRLLAGYRRLFAGDAPVLLRLDPALWPEAEYALAAACSAEQDQQRKNDVHIYVSTEHRKRRKTPVQVESGIVEGRNRMEKPHPD